MRKDSVRRWQRTLFFTALAWASLGALSRRAAADPPGPQAVSTSVYLNTVALLLDETHRSLEWVMRNYPSTGLATHAQQLADARVKLGRTLLITKDVDKAHPHLLLVLELTERALAAASDGENVRFLRFLTQSREEEHTFRTLLIDLKQPLPEVDKADKKR